MSHGTSNLILGLYLTSSKFENKELSILGSFYLHEVLEELKRYFFFFTNFHFERVLRSVILIE